MADNLIQMLEGFSGGCGKCGQCRAKTNAYMARPVRPSASIVRIEDALRYGIEPSKFAARVNGVDGLGALDMKTKLGAAAILAGLVFLGHKHLERRQIADGNREVRVRESMRRAGKIRATRASAYNARRGLADIFDDQATHTASGHGFDFRTYREVSFDAARVRNVKKMGAEKGYQFELETERGWIPMVSADRPEREENMPERSREPHVVFKKSPELVKFLAKMRKNRG